MIINTVSSDSGDINTRLEAVEDIVDCVPVSHGGTGATSLASGQLVEGNGTSAATTRAITDNTAASGALTRNTNIPTMNTLSYGLNRTTGVASADANYTTYMARGIAASTTDLTAGSSTLANGLIYLVYQ